MFTTEPGPSVTNPKTSQLREGFSVVQHLRSLVLATNVAEIIYLLVPCACASFSPFQNHQGKSSSLCLLLCDFVRQQQKEHCSRNQESQLTSCVILGKSLSVSGSQFPQVH